MMSRILTLALLGLLVIAGFACQSGSRNESNGSTIPGVTGDSSVYYEEADDGVMSLRPEAERSSAARPGRHGFMNSQADPSAQAKVTAMLADADELWILSPDRARAASTTDDLPGSGSMVTLVGEDIVPLPLQHTAVDGTISGTVAEVSVVQQFANPFDTKIEARYVFPLPHDAAVTDFVMQIGERRIRGIIRERGEAEQIYRQARSQGFVASLLTQERPNIFTQSVANLEPGKAIDVEITYFNALKYLDGAFEFVFPMVVGPRYNPPGTTDGVAALPRGASGSSQATEVNYLRPNERSGHDIALTLSIDAGLPLESIDSPSHAIRLDRDGETGAKVALSEHDSIPNKDFVLRLGVASDRVKSGIFTHRDSRGGFFALTIVPPKNVANLRRQPMEFVFVLDCSGSMNGQPMALAKGAAERCLARLEPNDTFQIIRFSEQASALGRRPILATPGNVRRGLDYLENLRGGGGTKMLEGIHAALDFPADPERQRVVSFLTDGFIGNELDIMTAIQERLGDTRLFSFGVGSSVNRYLLDGMARLGRGAVAYVGLDESAAKMADVFYERISHPAMSDIQLDFRGVTAMELSVARVPDLFVGRPVTIFGRLRGSDADRGHVVIEGSVNGRRVTQRVEIEPNGSNPALASLWARARIRHWSDLAVSEASEALVTSIRELALTFNLMSKYTAFVAVDSSRRTDGDHGVVVPVAVPVPDGVKYETTVGGDDRRGDGG